jgi:Flp pilus assembly CpaE family ATPase
LNDLPYVIICHSNPAVRARFAEHLRRGRRFDSVERLSEVLDLLALAVADCLVVELPGGQAERAVLGRIVAAYPDTLVVAVAAAVPFDDARELLRLGIHDVVPESGDPAELAAAVQDGLAQRRIAGAAGFRGTAVLVVSGKGGAGCTAIALHLTAVLARHSGAAAVDADAPPFGGLAAAADVDPEASVAALVRQHLPLDAKVLRRVGVAHAAGFSAFALWAAPGDADDTGDAVAVTMDALTGTMPFVVVDVGRPVLPAQRLLLRRAGTAVAVATLDLLSLRGLRAVMDLLASDGVTRILPVLNRAGAPASYTVGQAESALGAPFAAVLPETPHLSRCLDDGALMGAAAPQDPWWRGVVELGGRIAEARREEFRGALSAAP